MNWLLHATGRVMTFSRRYPLWILLVCVAAFISFVVAASMYADILTWDNVAPGRPPAGLGLHLNLIGTLARDDASYYIHIARDGYDQIKNTAFLPLYPILIRLVSLITHLPYAWSALWVAWLSLAGAAVVIYKWANFELKRYKVGKAAPWILLAMVAIFPTSFYLALPYTESLFVLLSVTALWSYRRGNYWAASVTTALATATRYQGLVLCLFFLTDFIIAKPKKWPKLVPAVLGGTGFLAYLAYLTVTFGSPLTFLQAERLWHRVSGNVVIGLMQSFTPTYLWFFMVLGVGLWAVWRYLDRAYFFYSVAFILMPLSSGRFDSINRYMLSMLPMFLALTIYIERKPNAVLKMAYVTTGVFLLAWSILLFANGYWVA